MIGDRFDSSTNCWPNQAKFYMNRVWILWSEEMYFKYCIQFALDSIIVKGLVLFRDSFFFFFARLHSGEYSARVTMRAVYRGTVVRVFGTRRRKKDVKLYKTTLPGAPQRLYLFIYLYERAFVCVFFFSSSSFFCPSLHRNRSVFLREFCR